MLLYGKGSLPLFDEEAAIAVVGTRSCTPYGLRCAHRMGYELARQGKEVERRPRPVTIHALELVLPEEKVSTNRSGHSAAQVLNQGLFHKQKKKLFRKERAL